VEKAFVLGAGLGTRLHPLTETLPKPLVPVHNRPLITHAFDHLLGAGVGGFIINTHHLASTYRETFPEGSYRGAPLTFRHEPVLLETGGGIANIADLCPSHLIVYNGDILSDLPLEGALGHHKSSGSLVTLVLRSNHPAKHIAFDPGSRRVLDIRNRLDIGAPHEFGFTGIYVVSPEFFPHLPPVSKYSVIPVFLDLIKNGGQVSGFVVDGGTWSDLGDRETYLRAHCDAGYKPTVATDAHVHPSAILLGATFIGSGAKVSAGSQVTDSVLWPGSRVGENATLKRCIVRTGKTATGNLTNVDV